MKSSFPLDNKCLASQLIYQADVTNNLDGEYKYYLGLKSSKNSTELSNYVWSLRENTKMPSIKWKIVKIVYSKATSSF